MHKSYVAGVLMVLVVGIASAGTSYVRGNGQLIAKINDTGIYYHHPDHLGSTSAITNEAGGPTAKQNYLPFGENFEQGVNSGRYEFSGKELDETGLQYLGARYYNPLIGRFLNSDPAKDGVNWYLYAANNPLRYKDFNGLSISPLSVLPLLEVIGGATYDWGDTPENNKRIADKEVDALAHKSLLMEKALVRALLLGESGLEHFDESGRVKESSRGALGTSQIRPETAKDMHVNPYELSDNIKGGVKYFNKCLFNVYDSVLSRVVQSYMNGETNRDTEIFSKYTNEEFKKLAIAAYNWGPEKIKEQMYGEQYSEHNSWEEIWLRLPEETQNHIRKVMTAYYTYKNEEKGKSNKPVKIRGIIFIDVIRE